MWFDANITIASLYFNGGSTAFLLRRRNLEHRETEEEKGGTGIGRITD